MHAPDTTPWLVAEPTTERRATVRHPGPCTMLAMAAAAAIAGFATTAQAQGLHYQTMPLGGGWSTTDVTGPNGQRGTGTTMPLGDGWSTTDWRDNRGNRTTCTTMPLGGGFSTTDCR